MSVVELVEIGKGQAEQAEPISALYGAGRMFSGVIPAYNEARTVRATVDVLRSAYPAADLVVVDDGSRDDTASALDGSGARVLRHNKNRGYGAALKTGVRNAREDVVVFCDADGQHDPRDIARLLDAMGEGVHMVIGQRTKLIHSKLWRMPGKWLLGWLANYLTRTKIPDLNSGLRAVRKELVLDYIDICPNGFSMSSTLTIAALAEGLDVRWVPIQIMPRPAQSVSTVKVKTGFDTLLLVMRVCMLFEPLRVFLPLSFVFCLLGLAWALPFMAAGRGVSVGAMLAITTGVLTFFFGLLADQNTLLRKRRR